MTVAWDSKCKGTHRDMQYLDSNQEEACTKLVLHAVDATVSGATRIDIVLPDTDVFVLALRRHAEQHSKKRTTCSGLMKTGLNNVLLPTLFKVVNNIEQVDEPELACNQV